MSFQKIIKYVIEYEGGYSNNPNDAGGETKFGVTHHLFEDVYPEGDWYEFTLEDGIDFYREVFWKDYLNDLNPALQLVFLDTQINHGNGKATRMIQKALGVVKDGIFGPMSLQAAKECDIQETILSILEQRKVRMLTHPTMKSGLISRLLKLQGDALNLYAEEKYGNGCDCGIDSSSDSDDEVDGVHSQEMDG